MRWLLAFALSAVLGLPVSSTSTRGAEVVVSIDTPVSPPVWALLERELLDANTEACREFFAKYFDEQGFLLCVERWGGDDGPDDAIENVNDWPILHALGADDDIRRMVRKAWEGHLRQFTLAKTTEVPLARDGMYYKEFPVMFDWQHNAEGLGVFMLLGLSDAEDSRLHQRSRRFAGFYLNDDPGAPNYDPEHKIIRSLFNGSRGPLLRKATALDWAGDPIEVENRFSLVHGERRYEEMLAHFEEYTDIVGDHPLNLLATCLPLNAFMVDHEPRYRDWVIEYVDAWVERMQANGNVIPSNIGLDGTVGGEADGKWYGGTYGWAFTVTVPQTGELAHRNRQERAFVGFMNAYLLTGADRYLDIWRKQADVINAQQKSINGTPHTPRMYGDEGWYGFVPGPYTSNALEIWYLSQSQVDRRRAPRNGWLSFLEGDDQQYPERSLREDLDRVRRTAQAMRRDASTPDTRLADDPMKFNPCQVESLIQLMLGGIHVTRNASVLHCRVRYFDPEARRPGLPDDVAALVEGLSADSCTLRLVNTNQVESREVIIQAGGYGEHQFTTVRLDDATSDVRVDQDRLSVRLVPGAGCTLVLGMQRYVNPPTMKVSWMR